MACGERLADGLRQAGFRITPQRMVILEQVAHSRDHQSAQEVFDVARQRLPGLNLATVYRTLDSLHQVGLIDLLDDGTGSMRFSWRDPDHYHAHLVCRACGGTFELPASSLRSVAETIVRKTGFCADLVHQTFSGLCRECADAEAQL
jgi:Fur family ferric uptake transcriptional regulator